MVCNLMKIVERERERERERESNEYIYIYRERERARRHPPKRKHPSSYQMKPDCIIPKRDTERRQSARGTVRDQLQVGRKDVGAMGTLWGRWGVARRPARHRSCGRSARPRYT